MRDMSKLLTSCYHHSTLQHRRINVKKNLKYYKMSESHRDDCIVLNVILSEFEYHWSGHSCRVSF